MTERDPRESSSGFMTNAEIALTYGVVLAGGLAATSGHPEVGVGLSISGFSGPLIRHAQRSRARRKQQNHLENEGSS